MPTRYFPHTLMLAGAAMLCLAAPAAAQVEPQRIPINPPAMQEPMDEPVQDTGVLEVKSAGNITYVTGGIGDEERVAMESIKPQYNFHVMSAGIGGHFAGDTNVTLRDSQGNDLVTTPIGPLFYAKLPPGSYTLHATNKDEVKTHRFTVGSGKTAHVHLSWKHGDE